MRHDAPPQSYVCPRVAITRGTFCSRRSAISSRFVAVPSHQAESLSTTSLIVQPKSRIRRMVFFTWSSWACDRIATSICFAFSACSVSSMCSGNCSPVSETMILPPIRITTPSPCPTLT